MIELVEPQILQNFLFFLSDFVQNNNFLYWIMPKLADVFVFTYPIFLVWIYVVGIVQKNKEYKKYAVFIFLTVFFTIFTNILFQLFFEKPRPIYMIQWFDSQSILHAFLPPTSFPSDHAVVSISISLITIFIGQKHNLYLLRRIWFLFLIFAFLMWFARIAIWVHRITDIIWWFLVAILCFLILISFSKIKNILKKISDFLISVEEKILYFFYKKWKY